MGAAAIMRLWGLEASSFCLDGDCFMILVLAMEACEVLSSCWSAGWLSTSFLSSAVTLSRFFFPVVALLLSISLAALADFCPFD